jgi:hypothetical protein
VNQQYFGQLPKPSPELDLYHFKTGIGGSETCLDELHRLAGTMPHEDCRRQPSEGWRVTSGGGGYTRCGRMKDLTDARWIKLKGILFLIIGLLAATLLVLEQRSFKEGVLLAITIWCFCRFYYFAFYVIEKYVDPGYRFSGLWSFACYLVRKR